LTTVKVVALTAALAFAGCSGDSRPPRIEARYPAAGDAQVFASASFRVRFDEPLDPATVVDGAVCVYQENAEVPAIVALEEDGRTVRVTAQAPLAIPGWVRVEPTRALADLAGNAHVPESEPWTFSLPPWVRASAPGAGAAGRRVLPTVALDADAPVVALSGLEPWSFSARLEDGAWTRWGGRGYLSAVLIADALDEAVWGVEWDAHSSPPGLRRGEAGATTGILTTLPYSALEIALAPRTDDVVMVWHEGDPSTPGADSLNAGAWMGGSFQRFGKRAVYPMWIRAAAGAGGAVVAAWKEGEFPTERVVAWVGPFGFELVPLPPTTMAVEGAVAVAVTATGDPVVAFVQRGPSQLMLRVRRWTGATWEDLASGLPLAESGQLTTLALALDRLDAPVVAWAAGEPRTLRVARIEAGAWVELGGPLNADPTHDVQSVSLVLDRSGAPVLAWSEATGETEQILTIPGYDPEPLYEVQVARLNH
jgi:hypothetical protein